VGLWLLGASSLSAVAGDRLKQFALISMVGLIAPGSSIELLKLNVFMQVPMLLFTPLVGVLLDHINKAWMMFLACLLRAAFIAAIPLVFLHSGESLYALYGAAFVLAGIDLTFAPARSAILPELVPRAQLLSTNAAFWSIGIASTLIGILGGGWLFDARGWSTAFHGGSLLYMVAAVGMAALAISQRGPTGDREPASPSAATGPDPNRPRAAVLAVRDAVRLIRRDRAIAVGLCAQAGMFAVGGVVAVIAVARVQESVVNGQAFFLAIVAAALVVGLVVGSGLPAIFHSQARAGRVVPVATLIAGVALAGLGRTVGIIPVSIWAAVLGLSLSPAYIVTETLLQKHSPREFLGRVFAAREALAKSAYLVFAGASVALNALVAKGPILVGTGLFLALLGVVLERTNWLDTPDAQAGAKQQ